MPTTPTVKPTTTRAISALRRDDDEDVRPYVIVAEIGQGSFATVYKGYHEVCAYILSFDTGSWSVQETHVQVAIKTVRRDNLSAKLFENLQSEIQILKALSHRHITKLTDIVVRAES